MDGENEPVFLVTGGKIEGGAGREMGKEGKRKTEEGGNRDRWGGKESDSVRVIQREGEKQRKTAKEKERA